MSITFRKSECNQNYNYQYKDKDNRLAKIDKMIDDEMIREVFSSQYPSILKNKGRRPLDPVVAYRAHLLYFLKRSIVSFNELPAEVQQKEDYQQFCRCQGLSFTAAYLSQFRKERMTVEITSQLHSQLFEQLTQLTPSTESTESTESTQELMLLRIGILDSVPMPTYSTPTKKKRCACKIKNEKNQKNCSCNCAKSYSDVEAAVGRQRPTLTRTDKVLGYRKHAVHKIDLLRPGHKRLPALTEVYPANVADISVLDEMIPKIAQQFDILLVDQAIYDFEKAVNWFETYRIMIIVKPKKNAKIDDTDLSPTKSPKCDLAGEPLNWSHFDFLDNVNVYRCSKAQGECLYQFNCPRQFEYPYSKHPTVLGFFPAHTRPGRFLLRLRKLIEGEFGAQTLWQKMKSLPFRGLNNFKLLGQLMDTAKLLQKMAQPLPSGFS